MNAIPHVLVATDFGPASQRALDAAAEIADRFDARLTVLHVLEPSTYPYPVRTSVPVDEQGLDRIRHVRLAELDDAVVAMHARRPDATGLLLEGTAWQQIVKAATTLGASLVVMGSHGRRGASRWIEGSVAEHVLRQCPVPVLTVKGAPPEARVEPAIRGDVTVG